MWAQALAFKISGYSTNEIKQITSISVSAINCIIDRAIKRGLDLNNLVILDIYIADSF